jgi:dimethylamine/trimethylamine dehydrogenase
VHHEGDTARLVCAYTGRERDIGADAIVSVTFRLPDDSLVGELQTLGLVNVQAIGDAWSPGTIAEAVYSGRLYAEELQAPARPLGEVPFRREVIQLA